MNDIIIMPIFGELTEDLTDRAIALLAHEQNKDKTRQQRKNAVKYRERELSLHTTQCGELYTPPKSVGKGKGKRVALHTNPRITPKGLNTHADLTRLEEALDKLSDYINGEVYA